MFSRFNITPKTITKNSAIIPNIRPPKIAANITTMKDKIALYLNK